MADITNEELRNLILTKFSELDKKVDARFVELDKKIDHLDKKIEIGFAQVDVKFAEMDKKMEVGFAELRGEIKRLEGDIKSVDVRLDGFDSRISYQEFVSKGVFVTVLGGILLTLARFFLTFDPKRIITSVVLFFKTIDFS